MYLSLERTFWSDYALRIARHVVRHAEEGPSESRGQRSSDLERGADCQLMPTDQTWGLRSGRVGLVVEYCTEESVGPNLGDSAYCTAFARHQVEARGGTLGEAGLAQRLLGRHDVAAGTPRNEISSPYFLNVHASIFTVPQRFFRPTNESSERAIVGVDVEFGLELEEESPESPPSFSRSRAREARLLDSISLRRMMPGGLPSARARESPRAPWRRLRSRLSRFGTHDLRDRSFCRG